MSGTGNRGSWWRRTILARQPSPRAALAWLAAGCVMLAAAAGTRSTFGTIAAAALLFSLKLIAALLVLWLLLLERE